MRTQHILIVEGESKATSSLSKMLEHASKNYRVSTTRSAEAALELIKDRSVDLLVTELHLPGASGLKLIKQLRTLYPQIRAILISAHGSVNIEAEAQRLKVYRYIRKPFHIEVLLSAVQEALASER